MARKTKVLATGEIYHVINRGIEKRDIFTCDSDYYRFIHDLYEFNDEDAAIRDYRYILTGSDPGKIDMAAGVGMYKERKKYQAKKRKLIVEILAFCLMPNHFHLLLRQVKDGGIPLFVKKIGGGYAGYFNKKYKRVGPLFQGRYKAVEIKSDEQLATVFSYIHTNPVELVERGWKEEGVSSIGNANKALNSWKWSSYLDYSGTKNFPSVTGRGFFFELFGGTSGCREVVEDWIKHKAAIYEDWKDVALD